MTRAKLVASRFDYGQLDADVAAEMRGAAERVRHLVRSSVIDVGLELFAMKQQLEHGQFVTWVERECGVPIRTAQRAMQAVELVEKHDKLSYLPPDGLLALAKRAAPDPVVAEIIESIDAGAQPSAADIKRKIAAARNEAKALRGAQAPAEKPAEEGEVVSAAAAATLAAHPSTGARLPASEAELAALIGAWDRAGDDARAAFLHRIAAVLPTEAQIEAADPPQIASSEPTATLPVRLDDGSLGAITLVAQEEDRPTAPSEPSATVQERSDKAGVATTMQIDEAEQLPAVPPTAVPGEVGLQAPQIDLAEDRPAAPPYSITPGSAPRDTGGCTESEAPENWVGRKPPPGVTCHTMDGECRYGRCARSGRCLCPAAHRMAAA